MGFIGPLSGDAAVLGIDAVPAIQIAFAEENSRGGEKFELLIEDDQYQTAKTLAAYEKLVRVDKVKVLFILTYGGVFALQQRAQDDGVLIIDTLDCDEKLAALPPNFLCISKTTESLGRVTAEIAFERRDYPAGIIYYESDSFMGTLSLTSKERLEQLGGRVAMTEGYQAGTTDFKSLLLKANQRGIKSLFLYGYDDIGNALRQARDLGMKQQFYSWNCVSSPGFRAAAQGAEEGMIVSTFFAPRRAATEQFIEAFKRHTSGRTPAFEVSTFPSYDAAKLLSAGYRAFLKSDRRKAPAEFLREYLLLTKDYDGLSGSITVDPDGAARSIKTAGYRVIGGELKPYSR